MDIRKIEEMIRIYPGWENLPCAVAHYIAASLGISPKEVGDAANSLKVKLDQCQLGLFGYGRKGISPYKLTGRPVAVPDDVLEKIRAAAKDGRVGCRELWDIATASKIPRAEIGNAADSLGIKITPCQIGAFK
ncbi:MAG TPA: hypothetical protein PLA83_10610 [Deltaproteobacteria bacterium]|jgi:hypothetical protein|nr:hypothetical protein [Deltaproteobacteria bacterium]HQH99814.1 hypothetical protein [Deltaproteobacteria bacterium]HQJ09874.1 hypothetical protein [Deltaproteobacteria bacterium]